MSETLLRLPSLVLGPDGTQYEARACTGPLTGGIWQGWIEFVPIGGGVPIRSPRETTQPNRAAVLYWATGLTPVYLEGALSRALVGPLELQSRPPAEPSIFPEPAGSV